VVARGEPGQRVEAAHLREADAHDDRRGREDGRAQRRQPQPRAPEAPERAERQRHERATGHERLQGPGNAVPQPSRDDEEGQHRAPAPGGAREPWQTNAAGQPPLPEQQRADQSDEHVPLRAREAVRPPGRERERDQQAVEERGLREKRAEAGLRHMRPEATAPGVADPE
jgi:hypothetical protein